MFLDVTITNSVRNIACISKYKIDWIIFQQFVSDMSMNILHVNKVDNALTFETIS